MDQFSHDLTIALEETSLLDRAQVGRWGQRRRTRSTGNLPCAPQPTEDSSSSPTDANTQLPSNGKLESLQPYDKLNSESDERYESVMLPYNKVDRALRMGTIESDSLNETFSPARFFKPNTRRKRKFKRTFVECDPNIPYEYLEASSHSGTPRKRVLKPEVYKSTIFFSGKRKRSNQDRYYDCEQSKLHSFSMPRQNISPLAIYIENNSIRPRSFSSTSQPSCNRILPLNKGLVSKIEKISNVQKIEPNSITDLSSTSNKNNDLIAVSEVELDTILQPIENDDCCAHIQSVLSRKKYRLKREKLKTSLQFDEQVSMECGELYDFLSSSSLSSSDLDNEQTNDTDREGDDELTDWPGNEGNCLFDSKYDIKRKLTKKTHLISLKSEDNTSIIEDDTLMGIGEFQIETKDTLEIKYQPSEPIAINKNISIQNCHNFSNTDISIPLKQIESEMSGETSNTFLSSPPCQPVREIRAGCRRIKCERPGFSIKTSVNERLARFLQDARQAQIRLPDIEIYEHDSLINLAKLYSLQMSLDKGCAVLTKTNNTTQSVNVGQQSIHAHLFLGDYKRRCYESKGTFLPRK